MELLPLYFTISKVLKLLSDLKWKQNGIVLNSYIDYVHYFRGLFSKTLAVYDNEIDGYISLDLPSTGIATLVYK